jgi:hypothetical protein
MSMKRQDVPVHRVSRRALLRGAPLAAGVAVAATLAAPARAQDAAAGQQKVSQAEAQYQDQPKNGQKCATCQLFQPPKACQVVASPVSANGWCQFYSAKT